MEIPENVLKEIKLSFTTKTAYEKEGVDAYIQELFMQINDAKRAAEFKQKELNECKKMLKQHEESRMLEGGSNDMYDDLIAERDAAKNALIGVREQLSDTEDKLQEANEKILALTEECEKYDEALAKLQAGKPVEGLPNPEENVKLREALQAAAAQIDALNKGKAETEARLEDAYRELQTTKEQLAKQPVAAAGEAKPASDNMLDLFAETQTFLNAAKEKATALTADAEQRAAKILEDAEAEAKKIREAAQTDTAAQQKQAAGELDALGKQLTEIRTSIAAKLEEAAAIAAAEAEKLKQDKA